MADDWKKNLRPPGAASSSSEGSAEPSGLKGPPMGVHFLKKNGDFLGFGYQSLAFVECTGGKLLRVGFHSHEVTLKGMNLGRLAFRLIAQAVDRVEEQHDGGGVKSQEAEEKKDPLVLGMEWKRVDGGEEGP